MNSELQPEPQAMTSVEEPGPLVLIVDDDPEQVETLAYPLQRLGFQTRVAYTGRDALEQARDVQPDVTLLDVQLPDMSGFEVCARLSDAPETCGKPIIVLSGSDHEDLVRNTRGAGGTFFVGKPYDPNALLALIQHAIQGLE